jgi:hypothetical protein
VLFGGPDSGLDPMMVRVMLISMVAVVCVTLIVLVDRYRLEGMRHELDELRLAVDMRANAPNSAAAKELP